MGLIYPRGETAGSLHDGILTMSGMAESLHYPLLLETLDRAAYADALAGFCARRDLVATYSKFVQMFTVAEYLPTREARAFLDLMGPGAAHAATRCRQRLPPGQALSCSAAAARLLRLCPLLAS